MKKVVAKRDAGALSPAALIHFFTECDDHSPGAVESWDMLLANVESQETLGVFMALADFTRAITEADPRTLAYLSQLSVVHYLLGLLEVPIFHPFTETIIRAIEDAMIIPGLNFEGLCGRSLLATLFTTLPPRCRDAAVVLRMARPLVVAWPPLGVEFLADGHAAILFETYATTTRFTQDAIWLLLHTLITALPIEFHSLYTDIAVFARGEMVTFPGKNPYCVDLFHVLLRYNQRLSNEYDLASFDIPELYRRLLFPLRRENRNALLDFIRQLFKNEISEAISAFEWKYLQAHIGPNLDNEYLIPCKLIPLILCHRPDLVGEAVDGGVIDALVSIGARGTFPVKKWVFRSLALLVEMAPPLVVPMLLETSFVAQVVDMLEGSSGKLLDSVLRFVCRLVFAVQFDDEPLAKLIHQWQIIERVIAIDASAMYEAEQYQVSIVGVARTMMPFLFGE
jgi:hypothetical protein